jgi:hypothetical protein
LLVGSPVRVSDAATTIVPLDSSAAFNAPTPERIAPPMSIADTSSGRRSAVWIAFALVLSR